MTAHDPSLALRGDRILNIFRRINVPRHASPFSQLIGDIADFLADHDLEIDAFTLTAAHDCVSGNDPRLAREIDCRVEAGKSVSHNWLRQTRAETSRQTGLGLLTEVMNQLEQNIEEFSQSTHAARSATRDYNSVLAQHGSQLEKPDGSARAPHEIVKLVRTIIDHTKAIEQEMARSEQKSQALRKELDQTRRSADQDHLTGLHNRRAFEIQFAKETEKALETGHPLCIGFCDIDHFKVVNDTHGHDTGDRVLRAVAQSLAKVTGDRCFVARHGGEEFAILFQDRTLQEAFQLFDEARVALAARRLRDRKTDTPIGPVTISGGLTLVRGGVAPSELLKEADEALYQAKRTGRNRIITAQV